MKPSRQLCLSLLSLLLAVPALTAAGSAAPSKQLLDRYADAIVGIELVVTLRLKAGDRELPPREQRIEVNGTVISAGGLTVTTLGAVDPQATLEAMRSGGMASRGNEIVGSDFKEVKLRLADGKEIPARFVLKDADLDLAFMAPEVPDPALTFTHVPLGESVEGSILDDFYYVSRAPKNLQRVPLMRQIQVIGVVERPRRFYLLNDPSLGAPVFNASGRVLGVTLQHFAGGARTAFVVLPAADIADMAKQAEAAQAR